MTFIKFITDSQETFNVWNNIEEVSEYDNISWDSNRNSFFAPAKDYQPSLDRNWLSHKALEVFYYSTKYTSGMYYGVLDKNSFKEKTIKVIDDFDDKLQEFLNNKDSITPKDTGKIIHEFALLYKTSQLFNKGITNNITGIKLPTDEFSHFQSQILKSIAIVLSRCDFEEYIDYGLNPLILSDEICVKVFEIALKEPTLMSVCKLFMQAKISYQILKSEKASPQVKASLFHLALENHSAEEIVPMIPLFGSNFLYSLDKEGNTPLHAIFNKTQNIEILVKCISWDGMDRSMIHKAVLILNCNGKNIIDCVAEMDWVGNREDMTIKEAIKAFEDRILLLRVLRYIGCDSALAGGIFDHLLMILLNKSLIHPVSDGRQKLSTTVLYLDIDYFCDFFKAASKHQLDLHFYNFLIKNLKKLNLGYEAKHDILNIAIQFHKDLDVVKAFSKLDQYYSFKLILEYHCLENIEKLLTSFPNNVLELLKDEVFRLHRRCTKPSEVETYLRILEGLFNHLDSQELKQLFTNHFTIHEHFFSSQILLLFKKFLNFPDYDMSERNVLPLKISIDSSSLKKKFNDAWDALKNNPVKRSEVLTFIKELNNCTSCPAWFERDHTILHLLFDDLANCKENEAKIKLLLESGADPFFYTSPDASFDGSTWSPFEKIMNSADICEKFFPSIDHVSEGFREFSTMMNEMPIEQCHTAIIEGDAEALTRALRIVLPGKKINLKDFLLDQQSEGIETILHFASCQNNPEIIRILIEAGFNPNLRDKNGWTPLKIAAVEKNLMALKALTECKEVEKAVINEVEVYKDGWYDSLKQMSEKHEIWSENDVSMNVEEMLKLKHEITCMMMHRKNATETEMILASILNHRLSCINELTALSQEMIPEEVGADLKMKNKNEQTALYDAEKNCSVAMQ